MRSLILLSLVTLAYAKSIEQNGPISAYGYNREVAIPLGEEIRKAEAAYLAQNEQSRISGGSPSQVGQFPYQAGILTRYIGLDGTGICGASLVSPSRLIYAAHCWFDGQDQGFILTVVLGSVTLFTGGTRIDTSDIVMHPGWTPSLVRNDVAVIKLATPVANSGLIQPVRMPTGNELNQNFAGETAVASGFGMTGDGASNGITLSQTLSFVELNVMANSACRMFFPANVQDSNICTSGTGGVSTCRGDSGGPLVVTRNNQPLVVGITSFGSIFGCSIGFPAVFARVSSFMDFFNQNM